MGLVTIGVMGGLLLVAAGLLLRTVWGQAAAGAWLLLVGSILVVAAIWQAGRRRPHTLYRPAPWRAADWLVAGGALATLAVLLLPLPGFTRASLFYSPYPLLAAPEFTLGLGLATWGLLIPAAVLAMGTR